MDSIRIVELGGMIPVTNHLDDTVPVVAFTNAINGVPMVRLIPETLVQAETLIAEQLNFADDSTANTVLPPVAHTRLRAVGFPAWPIMTDPDNAEHALNLVADVEWARKMAKSQSTKVWNRFRELTQSLTTSAPHFIPTLLEELARIFDDSGVAKFATRAFSKAREIERNYSLTIDNERHRQMFSEFARRGIIAAKDMGLEATSCMKRFTNPEDAYQYFLKLNTDRIRAGNAPYAGLPRDIIRVAKPTGRTATQVGIELLNNIGELAGMRHAPIGFVKALGKQMKGVLTSQPSFVATVFSTPATDRYYWYYDDTFEQWVVAFINLGGVETLDKDPEQFRRWLLLVLEELADKNDYSPSFIDLIDSHADVIAGLTLDETYVKLPLEIMEALTAAGVNWHLVDTEPYRKTEQLKNFFNQVLHKNQHRHKSITHLAAHPVLSARILQGWDLDDITSCAEALTLVNVGTLYNNMLTEACRSLEAATLPAVDHFVTALSHAVKAKLPQESITQLIEHPHLDPAHLLARNLNYGLITELVWPELERHVNTMRSTIPTWRSLGPKLYLTESYPGVVAFFDKQVAAVTGDQTLFNQEIDTPYVPFDMLTIPETDGTTETITGTTRVLALSGSATNKFAGTWDDGQPLTLYIGEHGTTHYYATPEQRFSSLPIPGGRVVGDTILTPGDREYVQKGGLSVYGDNTGSIWWSCPDDHSYQHQTTVIEYDPATNTTIPNSPPQKLIELISKAGLTTEQVDWYCTTFLPEITSQTVIPTTDTGELCCIIGWKDHDCIIITGDGTQYTYDTAVCGVATLGGGIRLVDKFDKTLYLPHLPYKLGGLEPTRDTRGEVHWMYYVPMVAWHNFRPRNEAASQRLRAVTASDVTTLLEAVVWENTKRGTSFDGRKSGHGTSKKRMYADISVNCQADSAAMRAAADLLGTDDPELCAGVVQMAVAVQRIAKRLTRVRTTMRMKEIRTNIAEREAAAAESTTETTTTVPQPAATTTTNIFAAPRKIQQLKEVMDHTRNPQRADWGWLTFVGQEKALVAWAMAPLTPPASRREAAAMLRKLAEVGVDKHAWRQVLVDWPKVVNRPRKAYSSMLLEADEEGNPRGILLNTLRHDMRIKKEARYRLLVESSTFPDTFREAATTGAAKTAHSLGIEPGMDAAEMREWADRLDAMEDIDPVAWKANKQPLIDALTARTFLTEAAATMLLAGGSTLTTTERMEVAVFRKPGNEELLTAEELRDKNVRKQLKLTQKTTNVAAIMLSRIPYAQRELIMTAAFDNNIALLDALSTEPAEDHLNLPDDLVEKYLGEYTTGGWYTHETAALTFTRLLHPLGKHPQFASNEGYGKAAGMLLDAATHLPADDARRGFIADQLEALKTVTHNKQRQTIPYSGDLNHLPNAREDYYWYEDLDALCALRDGCFDDVIADLKNPNPKPAGCQYDPRVMAPDTVASMSAELDLSENAATYFLQLLALVLPTDTNIKAWNNWKKKDLDAARAELVAKEFVVEGKRARAGRTVFLPGAWWEASSPYVPVEVWKSNFYLIRHFAKAEFTMPWCPPTKPLEQLFVSVWERWHSGDRPSFEALTTKKYRK